MSKTDYLNRLEFNKIQERISAYAVSGEAKDLILELEPAAYLQDAVVLLGRTDGVMDIIAKQNPPMLYSEDGIVPILRRAKKGGSLSMAELIQVKRLLSNGRQLRNWYHPNLEKAQYTDPFFFSLYEDYGLEADLDNSILSDTEMSDAASPALASIRKRILRQESAIRDKLDSLIHSQANAKYLQEAIVTMRGGRFVVPVKIENKNAVPGLVHDVSSSGSTLFIEPTAVVEANNAIMQLKAEEQQEIERILSAFTARVASGADRMETGHRSCVEIDVLLSKSRYALDNNCVIPDMNDQGFIRLSNARHPLIDKRKVVPITLVLGSEYDALVITGPNTGGKTVTLKTVGLLTIMASCGIPVPAGQDTDLSVFHHILVDIGDEQSIEQNLSTFSSHISNITKILKLADDRSLILLDELGSGTDPSEGAALAEAILEKLLSIGAKTIATSHYGEVKMFALETERVENASCDFDLDTLSPTYRLIMGIPGQSNALLICQRLGMDAGLISSASRKINSSNLRFEKVLSRLDRMSKELEKERDTVKELERQAQEKLDAANIESQRIIKESQAETERTKLRSRQLSADIAAEASKLIDELRKMDKNDQEARKKNISRAKQILNQDSIRLVDNSPERNLTDEMLPRPEKVNKGDNLYVISLSANAVVLSCDDGSRTAEVQSGPIRTKVSYDDLRVVQKKEAKKHYQKTSGVKSLTDNDKKTEVDVRGKTVEEAIADIEAVFDQAQLAHLHYVSIIHGKGTGALRKGIQNWLRRLSYVRSFRLGEYGEGDAGVTVVELK